MRKQGPDDDRSQWERGVVVSPLRKWGAAVLGLSALAAGAVATFLSSNGAGSAALALGGVALLLSVLLGDRLESLKVGNVEFHLREAARQLTQRADKLEAHGDSDTAEKLREEAELLLLRASPATRAYEELRRIQPAGSRRVAELSKIVDEAKLHSAQDHPSSDAVLQMFDRGGDGERVYALALMQEDPGTGNIDRILDAICRSRSAFEQDQALQAAIRVLPRLVDSDRERLSVAVRQQLAPGGHIERSTHRRGLAQQLLAALDDG